MAQIALGLRRAVRAQSMIDLVTSSVPRPPRALGMLLPPTPLLLAAVPQAGELAPQSHPPSCPGEVRTSLLRTTTVMMQATTLIVASASLLQTTRLAAATLAHQVVGAAVAPVVQAVPVAPVGGWRWGSRSRGS